MLSYRQMASASGDGPNRDEDAHQGGDFVLANTGRAGTTVTPPAGAELPGAGSEQARAGIEVVTIATPSLGDRSYLATDGEIAVVIDPQRDIDRVLAETERRGVSVTHVFETHIHNDYVSGGLALAQETGAAYHVNSADQVAFRRVGIADGDVVAAGPAMRLRVLATPGHTFTHLAYVLEQVTARGQVTVVAVFTGGSLLQGGTGRTDLLGREHAATLAAAQHASARRLAAELPDAAGLFPTHGFGSFCAAGPVGSAATTVGAARQSNPALTQAAAPFVAGLLNGLDDYPAYYARMAPANSAGPGPAQLAPLASPSAAEVARRIAAGEWVVDLRSRRAFAAGHLPGSLSFEYGDSFVTNLGWLLPPGAGLTLIGDDPGELAAAQRDLTRIGIDRIAGSALAPAATVTVPGPPELAAFPVSDFAGLARARREGPVAVLDVRRRLEWASGHIDGARHIPLHRLPAELGALPADPVWVHCQAGYRAAIAASLLQAAGHEVTAIDDSFDNAAAAGLPVTAP